ncbi:MAG: hypothetical protein ACRC41_14625 [Sarcina sp.]
MEIDDIFYRKLYNLGDRIDDYIRDSYFCDMPYEKAKKLQKESISKCSYEDFITKILMQVAINTGHEMNNISDSDLKKEIDKIVFEDYIQRLLEETNFSTLVIKYDETIEGKLANDRIRVFLKNFLTENAYDFYINDIEILNNFIVYINKENGQFKTNIKKNEKVINLY